MPNEFKVKNGLLVSGSANVNASGSGVFTVDGTSGRLFQVDDSLSGSLFSVNTAAGLPVIEAFSDNTVRIGQFGQRALFVSQSAVGIGKESALNAILDISGSTIITGSLTVITGSSIEFQVLNTGVRIGNLITDSHAITGSIRVSGSMSLTGSLGILGAVSASSFTGSFTGSLTGSLLGTASWATNALTASSANDFTIRADVFEFTGSVRVTGSMSLTGSFGILGPISASSFTGSYTGSLTGSLFGTASWAQSASRATTASYALNAAGGSGFPFSGSAVITGSLLVSGSGITVTGSLDVSGSGRFTNGLTITGSLTVITGSSVEFQVLNTGVRIGNISTDTHDVTGSLRVSGSITGSYTGSLTGALVGTSSWATNALTASSADSFIIRADVFEFTGSVRVSGSITGSLLGTAATASFVNTLNQNVIITNALAIGTSSIGSAENTLVVGTLSTGNNGEGGQISLQASGGLYTSASMLDTYQNKFRVLRGTNAGSDEVVTQFNLHTKQMQLPAYTSVSSFPGTAVANLAVDSTGSIITVSTSGGTVFPFTGIAAINGGLVVTGSITASSAIHAQANGAMYFRGGDDAELWDINVANTVGIYGQQDQTVASIKLGSGGGTISGRSGNIGVGTITPNSASLHVSGNVFATSFTGSLLGTAATASSADSFTVRADVFEFTGSVRVTGSITSSGDIIPGTTDTFNLGSNSNRWKDLYLSGSTIYLGNIQLKEVNGKFIVSGSGNTSFSGSFTGSLSGTASWAESASRATTASFALNAAGGSGFPFSGSAVITGSLLISGSNTTALQLIGSGSTILSVSGSSGSIFSVTDAAASDLNLFSISTGSINIFTVDLLKRVSISGSLIVTGSITGSLLGTASFATTSSFAISASYALSSSNALTASFVNSTDTNAFVQGGNSFGATATLGTNDANSLILETNGSPRVTLDSSGNTNIASGYQFSSAGTLNWGTSGYNIGQLTWDNNGGINNYAAVYAQGTYNLRVGTTTYPTTIFITGSNGNIAIGNTDPQHKIDIFTTTNKTSILETGSAVNADYIGNNANQYQTIGFTWKGSTGTSLTYWGLGFRGTNFSSALGDLFLYTGGTERVTITQAGNVGIGTTSPSSKLDVQGIIVAGNNSSTEGTIILQGYYSQANLGYITNIGTNRSSGGPVIGYGVYPSGVDTNVFLSSVTSSLSFERAAFSFDSSFRWYTGATQAVQTGSIATLTQKMILTNTGDLGIGISPSSKLDVSGDAAIRANASTLKLYGTDHSYIEFYPITSLGRKGYFGFGSANTTTLALANESTNGHTVLLTNGTGNVGIGITTPALKLQVDKPTQTINATSPSGAFAVSSIAAGNAILELGVDPTALAYIQSRNVTSLTTYQLLLNPNGGNVGIGTISSSATLDVSGSGKFTNGLTVTGSLTVITGSSVEFQVLNTGVRIGNLITDTHTVTGSLNVSGSITGSLFGTASWAQSASFINSTGNAFVQGGNSFTATAVLGTNDAQSLQLETNGSVRMTINSSGLVGVGTTTPSSSLNVNQLASTTKGIFISGDEVYQTGNGTTDKGVRIAVGVNRTGNRQLWIGDNDAFGSSTLSIFRYLTGATGYAGLDAVTGNGLTRLLTLIGTDTSDVGIGYDALSPVTASYVGKLNAFVFNQTKTNLYLKKSGSATAGNFIEALNTASSRIFLVDINGHVSSSVFSGSLFGTASWAISSSRAVTSSYALTSSFISVTGSNAFVQGGNSFTATAILGTNDNQNLSFETSGSVRMTISGSTGNVGIGITSPSQRLDVSGSVNVRSAAPTILFDRNGAYTWRLVNGDGTTFPISTFNIANNSSVPIATFLDGGNAGIGTTAPAYNLHVSSSSAPTIMVQSANNTGGQFRAKNTAGEFVKGIEGSTGGGWMDFDVLNSQFITLYKTGSLGYYTIYTNGSERITIKGNGNVGIGFTDPTFPINIASYKGIGIGGSSTYTTLGQTNSGVMSILGHNVYTDTGSANTVKVLNSDWYPSMIKMYYNHGITFHTTGALQSADSTFFNNTTIFNERMRIDINGNVGINNNTPNQRLDVIGRLKFRSDTSTTPGFWLTDNAGSENVFVGLQDATSTGAFGVYSNSDWRFTILNGGNVGIGIQTPTAKLHVSGSTGGVFEVDGAGTAGANALYVSASGNVGIGISSPSDPLHVIGTIRVVKNTTYATEDGPLMATSATTPAKKISVGYDNTNDFGYISALHSGVGWKSLIIQGAGGNVGVGGTSAAYSLDVTGTIRATGDVIAYSDIRVKDNIETITDALEKVISLRGVSYTRKDTDDKSRKIGVIAQEVLSVIPEVVSQDENGNYSVSYGNVVGLLIEAIKEQQKQIDELKYLLQNKQ